MPSFDEIDDGIFIGNAYSVVGNPHTKESGILEIADIQIVISALTEEEYKYYKIKKINLPNNIQWYRFIIDDDPNENISAYFFRVHKIIKEAISDNKNVMIHCGAGISRSSTLVIAYYIIENGWSVKKAIDYVSYYRPCILPNDGFIKALENLEHRLQN